MIHDSIGFIILAKRVHNSVHDSATLITVIIPAIYEVHVYLGKSIRCSGKDSFNFFITDLKYICVQIIKHVSSSFNKNNKATQKINKERKIRRRMATSPQSEQHKFKSILGTIEMESKGKQKQSKTYIHTRKSPHNATLT